MLQQWTVKVKRAFIIWSDGNGWISTDIDGLEITPSNLAGWILVFIDVISLSVLLPQANNWHVTSHSNCKILSLWANYEFNYESNYESNYEFNTIVYP